MATVKLIPYKGGDYTVPSVFAIDEKGNELIGHEAKRQWQLNPQQHGLRQQAPRRAQLFRARLSRRCARPWHTRSAPVTRNDVVIDVAQTEFHLQEIAAAS